MSGILRKEGIEDSGTQEPLQSKFLPSFSVRARWKSLDDKEVLCLWLTVPWVLGPCTQVAWKFRASPLGDASAKFPDQTKFQGWSGISEQKFAQKRRISHLYCSGSRDRSNQLAEGPHQSKINCGKRFFRLWRIGLDDGSRIQMVLRYCVFLNYEITERRAVTRQKGEKDSHRAEEWRMFSAEDTWVLFKKRRL